MKRRQLLKYTAGGAAIMSALGIYTVTRQPYQFHSSRAPLSTTTRYISGQPSLTDNRAIHATLLSNRDVTATILDLDALPNDRRRDLQTGYESGFWVATVAVLPSDKVFSPGVAEFNDDAIIYPNAQVTDDNSQTDERHFHYVFEHWNDPRPLATKPKEAMINW